MADTTLPKPDYATKNMRLVGYSDQGGRCDGVQIMVHAATPISATSSPRASRWSTCAIPNNPKVVKYVAAPPNTWTLHLQAIDDLLLVIHNKDMFAQPELADEKDYYKGSVDHHAKPEAGARNWSAGMAVYDISKPEDPKQIGFMPVEGTGLHRLWYVGGRWAYASALLDGFSDYILITIDMADPKKPGLAGKYWLPGMNVAAGEKANWPTKNGRFGLHHAIIHDDIAYCSWRDACLAVVDVKDKANPKLIVHKVWAPPFGGGTHNALPLPTAICSIVVDETVLDNQEDGFKPIWVFDNQVKSNPISISTFPAPSDKDYLKVGGHFGPHNVHENRPGSFVSAGADLLDIPERGLARLRHQGPVPAEGGGRLRAAAAGEVGGPAAEPADRPALGRRLRRQERALLRHRLQRRPLHRRIQGLRRDAPSGSERRMTARTARSSEADLSRRNMRLIGHTDQAGRSDGQQIMVRNGYAYIGHVCSKGFSVDRRARPDQARRPSTTSQNPPNTWSLHLQVHDDLLLLVHGRDMFSQPEMADERNYYKPKAGTHGAHAAERTRDWSAGMAVFDISKPTEPRQIGFMPVEGTGLHRIWYVGGRWAYASAMIDGFSDYILVTIDMQDPTKPKIVGRYWLPGMNLAAGEKAELAARARPLRPAPRGRRTTTSPIAPGATAAWSSST